MRVVPRWLGWCVLGCWILGCGGGDDGGPEVGPEPTPGIEDDDTPEPPTPPADWTSPACGDGASGDMDRTVDYGGGKLRLCVLPSEVRLWALDASGRPDMAFSKGKAEVRFTPVGGTEQMVSGIILKGSAGDGFATRMLGHGGGGVAQALVVVGAEEVSF